MFYKEFLMWIESYFVREGKFWLFILFRAWYYLVLFFFFLLELVVVLGEFGSRGLY